MRRPKKEGTMASTFSRGGMRLAIVATMIFAAAAGAAFATGAVGFTGGGTIQACAKTDTGQLRVVKSASDCLASETAISWNQQGPRGADGTALAYAHIQDGALDASRSKGVVSMTMKLDSSADNVYCFVLAATPINVVATPEASATTRASSSPVVAAQGTPSMSTTPCDPGTSAAVIYGFTSPFFAPNPGGFYVAFN
jgi:hypothetical protein